MDIKSVWHEENGVSFLACESSACQRKNPIYYHKDYSFNRVLVLAVLEEYVRSGSSKSNPVRCLDLIAGPAVNALIWKKRLADDVEVIVNANCPDIVQTSANKNGLVISIMHKDPCIVLHERGYNFVFIDCTNEASIYFDAAFRNIARNGIIAITTKDDCSLHGGTYDVAMRRYGGRIVRTHYASELGIRLFLASMARAAARFNKSIQVLCSTVHKSSFTVVVLVQKGPENANKCLEQLRLVKHCMVCEERAFYPPNQGFHIDSNGVQLHCQCSEKAPGETCLELGPLWGGNIFDAAFLQSVVNNNRLEDPKLNFVLNAMIEEARCPAKAAIDVGGKRLKLDYENSPPFYYNLHKHHPDVAHLVKLNKVIERLQSAGYRASKTHFDPLAVRTNAPLDKLYDIMAKEAQKLA